MHESCHSLSHINYKTPRQLSILKIGPLKEQKEHLQEAIDERSSLLSFKCESSATFLFAVIVDRISTVTSSEGIAPPCFSSLPLSRIRGLTWTTTSSDCSFSLGNACCSNCTEYWTASWVGVSSRLLELSPLYGCWGKVCAS